MREILPQLRMGSRLRGNAEARAKYSWLMATARELTAGIADSDATDTDILGLLYQGADWMQLQEGKKNG